MSNWSISSLVGACALSIATFLTGAEAQAQPQCVTVYQQIYDKMSEDLGYVTDAEISFALDCEDAVRGEGEDPGPSPKYTRSSLYSESDRMNTSASGSDSYALGAPLRPQDSFAYPVIQPRVRWVPNLTWRSGTRIARIHDNFKLNKDVLGDGSPTIHKAVNENRLGELRAKYENYARGPKDTGEMSVFLEEQAEADGGKRNRYVVQIGLLMDKTIEGSAATTMVRSGELGMRLRSNYRSGFVPDECLKVLDGVKNNDFTDAADHLVKKNGCWGRYRPAATTALFQMEIPEEKLSARGQAFLASSALSEGALDYAIPAAMRYMGLGSMRVNAYSKLEQIDHGYVPTYIAAMLEPAKQAYVVDAREASTMIGEAYYQAADKCLTRNWPKSLVEYYDITMKGCRQTYENAVAHTGRAHDILGGQIARWMNESEASYRAQRRKWEEDRLARAARRNSGSPSRNYMTTTPQTGTPQGAISSAEASRRATANMCRGSLSSTDFCQ